mgnify:CR=1 FL=1
MKRIEGISGIYVIVNLINGKYYVGSSYNIIGKKYSRLFKHFQDLKYKNHGNSHLQRAYDIYGEVNFAYFIVEYVPKENLLAVEQTYLDAAKLDKENVYNTKFVAVNNGPIKELAKNKISSSLTGRKLSPAHLEKTIINNKSRTGIPRPEVAGENNPDYDPTVYTFWNFIDNEAFIGSKYQFRKKFNLSQDSVYGLCSGKYKIVNKKWVVTQIHSDDPIKCKDLEYRTTDSRAENNPRLDRNIYEFFNKKTEETFIGIRKNFCKKFNLSSTSAISLVKGTYKSCRGWIFIKTISPLATGEQLPELV